MRFHRSLAWSFGCEPKLHHSSVEHKNRARDGSETFVEGCMWGQNDGRFEKTTRINYSSIMIVIGVGLSSRCDCLGP